MFGRRPAETRKAIEGLVILTLLAWATQTLISQWGLAAEGVAEMLPRMSEERFVPSAGFSAVAAVELRREATIVGGEIRLKQIARWSDGDGAAMRQIADLVVGRFEAGQATCTIDIESLKETLEGAGVNLAGINFRGAVSCKVTRSDARLGAAIAEAVAEAEETRALQPVAVGVLQPKASVEGGVGVLGGGLRSLRDLLIADLVERLNVPAESLQIRFNSGDEKLVELREPHFQFEVEPQRIRRLGDVTWGVTIRTSGASEKVRVGANVRMWQEQLVTTKPLAYKQIIQAGDIVERRVLVDRLSDEVVLRREQVVGQQAGRDLGPGTVLTGRMIEAVQLARIGQLVTVGVELGRVQVVWVGEAREAGCLGQTIRVRKPGTREEFSVVLTGPQQAKLIGAESGGAVAKAVGVR